MKANARVTQVQTVVIGAGQAGLSVGYHLARRGLPFVILDAHARVGDPWRQRWDSLRLFTPAKYDGLVGMPFPAGGNTFPTKNEMADYLETYAAHFHLPIRHDVTVTRVSRYDDHYLVEAGADSFVAQHVVVAMANYQRPRVPEFAAALDARITQIHSSAYRNPRQLQAGDVLIVGAGNSGAEIAMELSRSHRVWLSGRDTGHVPFRLERPAGLHVFAPLVLRGVFHYLLRTSNRIGRKVRSSVISHGGPLIRVKPADMAERHIERAPRVTGVRDGLPQLEDGRVVGVTNVIWCTGFAADRSWIDLPIFDGAEAPIHDRGVVSGQPGLYFVGRLFLYAMSSSMIHGVARDAEYVVTTVAERVAHAMGSRPAHATQPSKAPAMHATTS